MAHIAITKVLLCGLSPSFEVRGIWHRSITICFFYSLKRFCFREN